MISKSTSAPDSLTPQQPFVARNSEIAPGMLVADDVVAQYYPQEPDL